MRRPNERPLSYISVRFGPTITRRVLVTSTDVPCKGCGAPIIWCRTAKNRALPVNMAPELDGIRLTHFATCPKAAAWRRSGKGALRT